MAHRELERVLGLVRARHLELVDELGRDRRERIFGPRQEPVNRAAVDKARELLRATAELVADRREAEHHVQVVAHSLQEEAVQVLPRVGRARLLLLHDRPDVVDDHVELVLGQQACDLARHEDLVDVLEEALVLDLGVGEDEAHWLALEAGNLVQRLDVLKQVGHVVRLGDGDLERVGAGDVGRQAREALLAGAADADEQRRAARHREEPRDAHHVLDARPDVGQPARHRLVERRVRVGDLTRVVIHLGLAEEVDKVHGRLHLLHKLGLERVAAHVEDGLVDPLLVLVRHQLVGKHAAALVDPQRKQVALGGRHVAAKRRNGRVDVLVVELGGRRQHLGLRLVPQRDRHRHELGRHKHDLVGEEVGGEAALHEAPKDAVDRGDRWQRDVEDGVLALEAVGDVVFAAAWHVHGGEVTQVDQELHVADGLLQRVHAALLQQLAHNLVGDLVAPVVDCGHGDVVDEQAHGLAAWRAIRAALALLHSALCGDLEDLRRRQERKGDRLGRRRVGVERVHELVDGRGLGSAWAAYQQRRLLHQVRQVQQLLKAHRVERRDHELRKLGALLRLGVGPHGHQMAPVAPAERLLVHHVLVDGVIRRPQGPGEAEEENALVRCCVERLARVLERLDVAVEQRRQRVDEADLLVEHDWLEVQADEVEHRVDVLVEEAPQHVGLRLLALLQPRAHHRVPAQLRVRHVDDAGARDRRRRRVGEVLRLKERLHGGCHEDAVAVGECQHLVVVEHRVEVLDPDRVHRAVEHDPRVLVLVLGGTAPQHGKHAVGPVARRCVHAAKHLRRGDRLGVHAPDHVLGAELRQRARQALLDRRLAAAGRAHQHDTVAHQVGLVQLDALVEPRLVHLQALLQHHLLKRLGHVGERRALGLHAREQIVNERQEQRHVLRHKLGHVHVAQRAHHEEGLALVWVGAL
eukprot:54229-Chlamydomonas_euryale.AAC.10